MSQLADDDAKAVGSGRYHATLLGSFRVRDLVSGEDVTPKGRKARALLIYLILQRGPAKRERLSSLLWGDRGEDQARQSLRQSLYELRSLATADGPLIQSEREDISLVKAALTTDIQSLESFASGREFDKLVEGLSGWSGPIAADFNSVDPDFDAWLTSARESQQARLFERVLGAAEEALTGGDIARAHSIGARLMEIDPFNEPALRLSIRADHQAGDSSAAHRKYQRFEQRLKAELNAAPSTETQRRSQNLKPWTAREVLKRPSPSNLKRSPRSKQQRPFACRLRQRRNTLNSRPQTAAGVDGD
jgi:DNA-binding SARP family transcriptional activator